MQLLRHKSIQPMVDRVKRWTLSPSPRSHAFNYERVLGTSFELQVVAANDHAALRAEASVLAEVDRLELILSGYSERSELWRWQAHHGEIVPVTAELADVLAAAEFWRTFTGGAFNPAAVSLVELLRDSAASDERTRGHGQDANRRAAIEERLRAMRQPLWTVNRATLHACRLTQLAVSLDAIAKGYIVDRAAVCASRVDGVTEVLVNVGGDLRHVGDRPLTVRVADPRAPAENAQPVAVVRLENEALATSGGYRRGFTMDGQQVSHIIDPRSGRPASRVSSASVLAADCATADALSTAFSVLTPAESVALADSLPGVGCLLVEEDGTLTSNEAWRSRIAS